MHIRIYIYSTCISISISIPISISIGLPHGRDPAHQVERPRLRQGPPSSNTVNWRF